MYNIAWGPQRGQRGYDHCVLLETLSVVYIIHLKVTLNCFLKGRNQHFVDSVALNFST